MKTTPQSQPTISSAPIRLVNRIQAANDEIGDIMKTLTSSPFLSDLRSLLRSPCAVPSWVMDNETFGSLDIKRAYKSAYPVDELPTIRLGIELVLDSEGEHRESYQILDIPAYLFTHYTKAASWEFLNRFAATQRTYIEHQTMAKVKELVARTKALSKVKPVKL